MQYIDITKLQPHPKNPRKIAKRELKKLCESIQNNKEYFEARPVITNQKYIIYAGNSRYKAAIELGLKEIPVYVMNLPEKKMQEIMIRDNVNNGRWDEVLLSDYDFSFLENCGLQINGLEEHPEQTEQEKPKKNKPKQKKVVTCPHCFKEIEL
jgi:hypothetical protein